MIGLIFVGNIDVCPYAKKYIDILTNNNIDFEILFWNRSGEEKRIKDYYVAYERKSSLRKNKFLKILDFFSYSRWVNRRIKEKKYEKLVFLSTLSAFIINPIIIKKYNKKYLFDIRDYSFEKNKIFLKLEEIIIKNSYFTSISSKGFLKFLPQKYDYVYSHNIIKEDISNEKDFIKKEDNSVLNIVWLGNVRYFDYQRQLISMLGNDKRFKLVYHGDGPELEQYKKYCEENKYTNIIFTGKYNNKDKEKLLIDADFINNAYGYINKDNILIDCAISNKYYDGIIYGIPQIVEQGGYKGKKVMDENIGIVLDIKENFANELYEYYYSISEDAFNLNKSMVLKEIINEDLDFENKIKKFIMN